MALQWVLALPGIVWRCAVSRGAVWSGGVVCGVWCDTIVFVGGRLARQRVAVRGVTWLCDAVCGVAWWCVVWHGAMRMVWCCIV